MTPVKEIGECMITLGEEDYFFRPSFIAMTKIGDPGEIVQAFYDLHNDGVTPLLQQAHEAYGYIPAWVYQHVSQQKINKPAILAAMSVITACCDRDPTALVGEIIPGKSGKWTFVYRRGAMKDYEMVITAQSLITHGIIGKAKVRQLQRNESNEKTSEFNAFEYISSARNHLAMSRTEAESLTMTELQLMLASKYPEQKGYTREEYDAKADDFFEKRRKKLKRLKAS